jgi:hypothetical protein
LSKQERDYIPAATWDWLLPLYDPCEHLIRGGREKARLLSEAQIPPEQIGRTSCVLAQRPSNRVM